MQQQHTGNRVATNAAEQAAAPALQHTQERIDNAAPDTSLYQLDAQDLKAYQRWGLESGALWELRSPTREEWEQHLLFGRIIMILARAAWHPFQRRNPSAELWNLSLAVRGTDLEPFVLKYHRRFQRREARELHSSQDDQHD